MARMPNAVRSDLLVRRAALPEEFSPGGVAEIAHALKVTTSQVSTWIDRRRDGNGCPPPLWESRMGATYDVNEWRRWRQGEQFDPRGHADLTVTIEGSQR